MNKLWLALVVVLGASAFAVFHHSSKPAHVAAELRLENQHCHGSYIRMCDTDAAKHAL